MDDCSLIGNCREEVDAEMLAFQSWADDTCAVAFKYIKDRVAAQVQLALGFWVDAGEDAAPSNEAAERTVRRRRGGAGGFVGRRPGRAPLRSWLVVGGPARGLLGEYPGPPVARCASAGAVSAVSPVAVSVFTRLKSRVDLALGSAVLLAAFGLAQVGRGVCSNSRLWAQTTWPTLLLLWRPKR